MISFFKKSHNLETLLRDYKKNFDFKVLQQLKERISDNFLIELLLNFLLNNKNTHQQNKIIDQLIFLLKEKNTPLDIYPYDKINGFLKNNNSNIKNSKVLIFTKLILRLPNEISKFKSRKNLHPLLELDNDIIEFWFKAYPKSVNLTIESSLIPNIIEYGNFNFLLFAINAPFITMRFNYKDNYLKSLIRGTLINSELTLEEFKDIYQIMKQHIPKRNIFKEYPYEDIILNKIHSSWKNSIFNINKIKNFITKNIPEVTHRISTLSNWMHCTNAAVLKYNIDDIKVIKENYPDINGFFRISNINKVALHKFKNYFYTNIEISKLLNLKYLLSSIETPSNIDFRSNLLIIALDSITNKKFNFNKGSLSFYSSIELLKEVYSEKRIYKLLYNFFDLGEGTFNVSHIYNLSKTLERHDIHIQNINLPKKPKSFTEIHNILVEEVNILKYKPFALNQEDIQFLDGRYIAEYDVYISIPKTNIDLKNAGTQMNICVGGDWYSNSILEKKRFVILFKDKEENYKYCLDLNSKYKITEFKGVRNTPVEPLFINIIDRLPFKK